MMGPRTGDATEHWWHKKHSRRTRAGSALGPLLQAVRGRVVVGLRATTAVSVAEAALAEFPALYQAALQLRFTAKIGIESGKV